MTPVDYTAYSIVAPSDPRLPGGGGYTVSGLFDINPAKFGQSSNLVPFASNFGKQFEHYNGVDVTLNARLPRGAFLQGGLSTGRSETNNCAVVLGNPQLQFVAASGASVTAPRTQAYCDVKPPLQTQLKAMGSYTLPWAVQTSATFQSLPGPQILATHVVTNNQIAPSLGRNLAAGAAATVTTDLIPPGTMFGERLYQVDLRVSKIIRIGRNRIQANFDVYNALNANTILFQNNTYGPNWQQPTYILPGRLLKFGGQLDF